MDNVSVDSVRIKRELEEHWAKKSEADKWVSEIGFWAVLLFACLFLAAVVFGFMLPTG